MLFFIHWLLVSAMMWTGEARIYGMNSLLWDYGTAPLLENIVNVTLNLTSQPIVRDGYLIEWEYWVRGPPRTTCPTYVDILRKKGGQWVLVHTQKLGLPIINLGNNLQPVTNTVVQVQKNDIINIRYTTGIDSCHEPLMSATLLPDKISRYIPQERHAVYEEGVAVSINILVSEYRRVEEPPKVYQVAEEIILKWDPVQATDFILSGYQIQLYNYGSKLIYNRMVNENKARFKNLKYDEIYFAEVYVVRKLGEHTATDTLASPKSMPFCTERRKFKNCLWDSKQVKGKPLSNWILEIRYPEKMDKCIRRWSVAYWTSAERIKMTTSFAGLKETISLSLNSSLAYQIELQAMTTENVTEICRVHFKFVANKFSIWIILIPSLLLTTIMIAIITHTCLKKAKVANMHQEIISVPKVNSPLEEEESLRNSRKIETSSFSDKSHSTFMHPEDATGGSVRLVKVRVKTRKNSLKM